MKRKLQNVFTLRRKSKLASVLCPTENPRRKQDQVFHALRKKEHLSYQFQYLVKKKSRTIQVIWKIGYISSPPQANKFVAQK